MNDDADIMDMIVPEIGAYHSVPALSDDIVAGAKRILDEGTPENTKLAYRKDLAYAKAWGRVRGFGDELPYSVEAMMAFIVDHVQGLPYEADSALVRSGVKRDFGPPAISTLKRRMASLSIAHALSNMDNPCADRRVKDLLARARRAAVKNGWTPKKKAAAALEILDRMIETKSGSPKHDVRDRALLLFAWSSGGRRRSEVTNALVERVEEQGEDYVYRLGATKTVQDDDTGVVPVAGRAATALREWLDILGRDEGPIFVGILPNGRLMDTAMHPDTVLQIVKRRAKQAGFDPKRFAGHSLRSGFMTEAGLQGLDIREAMDMSMHRTMQVAAGYYQAGGALKNKASRLAG